MGKFAIPGLVLAAVGGAFALGWWARAGRGNPLDGEERSYDVPPPRSRFEAVPDGAAAPEASADALFEADSTFVEARVRGIAEHIRGEANRALADAERTARGRVEREVREERNRREDIARGGTMAFLRSVGETRMLEFVADRAQFAALFERREQGRRLDGATLGRETVLSPGDTIAFGRGRHRLDLRWARNRPFPSDVLIQGAGMEETLVVLEDELEMDGDVRSLTVRDLTLHCNDNYMTDMRSGAHTIRMENCRVIGFDMGAGGSVMLSANDTALLATRCRFEAGFGRSPGYGNLFRSSGALLVRLEDCEIVGPFQTLTDPKGTFVFERCRFTRTPPNARREIDRMAANEVLWLDSKVAFAEPPAWGERKPRSVRELNPTWDDRRP